jgi:hypothetical protein
MARFARTGMVLLIIIMVLPGICTGQDSSRHLLRLYEDNDFLNIAGQGTDKGYTNGTRIDYFFCKQAPSRFFVDRWLPKAGADAVNTFSYSLTQLMIVPKDISKPLPDRNDWPYAGALFLAHNLHSSNASKKFLLQSGIILGVMGPMALAEQTQTWMHSIIGYTRPMGWPYQMPNALLFNVNLLAEKMLWQPGRSVELLGGAQLQAGTLFDAAAAHVQVRIGRMQPYFNGYMGQFSVPRKQFHRRLQYYLILRPAIEWSFYKALLDGGVFNGKNEYYNTGGSPVSRKIIFTADAGAVLVWGNVSLAFIQKQLSPLLHGVSDQTIGNLSLTLAW